MVVLLKNVIEDSEKEEDSILHDSFDIFTMISYENNRKSNKTSRKRQG